MSFNSATLSISESESVFFKLIIYFVLGIVLLVVHWPLLSNILINILNIHGIPADAHHIISLSAMMTCLLKYGIQQHHAPVKSICILLEGVHFFTSAAEDLRCI
ncbi:uncharacterized protein F5891DRAFT_974215 [Suillus fuscotomentosus]|uniref:Uncharacterized protein n=1 Tax=Suillus fuscotomentosus TaxID=1912939 RepID=A0AAD4EMI8_9AGAM|nr:uncharacterized protein F5891DRAFT_974215 [Suillus fuscotomentosus]KAG1908934.1 hypothetical protein F5891DRAFT_974215 [Suillus fuscotomentosus]